MSIDKVLSDAAIRLQDGVGELWKQVPLILDDPRAYQREAMLLALMAVLLLVFFVLIVYSVYDAVDSAITKRKMGLHVKKRGRLRRLMVTTAIFAVAVFVVTIMPISRSFSGVCDSCHSVQPAVASWKMGDHKNVACYGCHASPGVLGASAASVTGVSRQLARMSNARSAASRDRTVVNSASCLRCHGALMHGTDGARIKMRHADVIDAGIPCLQCHGGVGHSTSAAKTAGATVERVSAGRSTMSVCLTCHDGKKASAACDVCHGNHPLNKAGTGFASIKTPAPVTCVGCHTPKVAQKCINCHGIELPHTAQFFMEHAGRSWKTPALCARCHEAANAAVACGCHSDENVHGTYSAWFPRHASAAVQAGRFGCNCHEVSFCMKCHTDNPFLRTSNPGTVATPSQTTSAPASNIQIGTPGSNNLITPQ